MARTKSLASMTTNALVKMRDEIGAVLNGRAEALEKELKSLGQDLKERLPGQRKGTKVGRKVPPKYRGPGDETWAGRGARPRWLRAQMKKGKKPEDFLIAKASPKKRKAK